MATPWRNCRASITLADEINRRWPGRDRASDGTVGDAAHATRTSDHNPWVVVDGVGVVRARDIDKDGIDAPWLVEHLRALGAAGDPRLTGGGYIIFNRRITRPDFTGWREYTGSNPHTSHAHVSFSRDRAGFDSAAPWAIHPAASAPSTEDDDMTPEQDRLLREVHTELTRRHATRADYSFLGEPEPAARPADTVAGFAINADARAYEARQIAVALARRLDALAQHIAGAPATGGLTADDVRSLIREALADLGPLHLTTKESP
jgi:hypothetical protein